MAPLRPARLIALSLLAGSVVSCAGGPTSDFPFGGGDQSPALGGDNGDYAFGDGGSPAADAALPGFGGDSGLPTEGVDAGSDAAASDAGCPDLDAGDAAQDAASSAPADAQSDATPDPCEGAEGGTSADGQAGSGT